MRPSRPAGGAAPAVPPAPDPERLDPDRVGQDEAGGGGSVFAAIALMLVGVFLLDCMGVLIKILSARYDPPELSAWRNLLGMIPTFAILWLSKDWQARGRPMRLRRWKLGLARGLFVTFAQICYYVALMNLEFATAATLAFSGPMFITALSALVLRHKVGAWRWSAVAAGFAGCVMVMQPGSDVFTLAAILPLGAALGYASSSVAAPLMDKDAPTPLLNLYASASALAASLVLALSWNGISLPASQHDAAMILAMGVAGGVGVVCLIAAYRLTAPATVAPFEYFGLLFAIALGWAVFGETPFDRLFPGALVIAGAGLVIAWRERVRSRKDKREAGR
ncbi:MAG: DMT family transporter [Pseudomonadota bacterium]